jgi:hypothetical protein
LYVGRRRKSYSEDQAGCRVGPRLTVCVRPRLISSTNDWPELTRPCRAVRTLDACSSTAIDWPKSTAQDFIPREKKVCSGFYERIVLLHRCKKSFELGLAKRKNGWWWRGGTRILRLVPGERGNDDRSTLLRRPSVSLPPPPSNARGQHATWTWAPQLVVFFW